MVVGAFDFAKHMKLLCDMTAEIFGSYYYIVKGPLVMYNLNLKMTFSVLILEMFNGSLFTLLSIM